MMVLAQYGKVYVYEGTADTHYLKMVIHPEGISTYGIRVPREELLAALDIQQRLTVGDDLTGIVTHQRVLVNGLRLMVPVGENVTVKTSQSLSLVDGGCEGSSCNCNGCKEAHQ